VAIYNLVAQQDVSRASLYCEKIGSKVSIIERKSCYANSSHSGTAPISRMHLAFYQ
jgi:hypothetical protein